MLPRWQWAYVDVVWLTWIPITLIPQIAKMGAVKMLLRLLLVYVDVARPICMAARDTKHHHYCI